MAGYTYGTTPNTPSYSGTLGEDPEVTFYYSKTNSTNNGILWENITSTTLDAGTYYMYAIVDETESFCASISGTTEFTVSKTAYDMSQITFGDINIDYDGEIHDITILGTLPTGVTVKYYVNNEEFTGATETGIYEITAKFTGDTLNHELIADKTATLTIIGTENTKYISLWWLIILLSLTNILLICWLVYMIVKHNRQNKTDNKNKKLLLSTVPVMFIPWQVNLCLLLGILAIILLITDLMVDICFKNSHVNKIKREYNSIQLVKEDSKTKTVAKEERKFKLYEHQEEILKEINKSRSEGVNTTLVVIPTGTGKSQIVIEDLNSYLVVVLDQ